MARLEESTLIKVTVSLNNAEPTSQSIKDEFGHRKMEHKLYLVLFDRIRYIRKEQQARKDWRYGRLGVKKLIDYLRKIKDKRLDKPLKTANFQVTEIWDVECPHCFHDQTAPFNHDNPMQPMIINCTKCDEPFTLTYDRED